MIFADLQNITASDAVRRINTFVNWPQGVATSTSPVVLANAGFVYSGHNERVLCPECQLTIDTWPSNEALRPLDEHRLRSPLCPLAISCAQLDNDEAELTSIKLLLELVDRQQSADKMANEDHATLNILMKLREVLRRACERVQARGSVIPTPRAVDRNHPDLVRLRSEGARLETYHDWPATAPVKPAALAAAGLFYTGQGDRVRCVFCNGALHHWVEGDEASSEHQLHFPRCPFIRGLEVGNVPLTRTTNVSSSSLDENLETTEQLPRGNTPASVSAHVTVGGAAGNDMNKRARSGVALITGQSAAEATVEGEYCHYW